MGERIACCRKVEPVTTATTISSGSIKIGIGRTNGVITGNAAVRMG